MTRKIERNFIIAAFFAMLAWQLYVELYATRTMFVYINRYHIDKIFHVIGGAFVIAILFHFFGSKKFAGVVITILLVSFVWELAEMLFDPKTIIFLQKSRTAWAWDTVGDTIFGVVGALAYYFSARPEK